MCKKKNVPDLQQWLPVVAWTPFFSCWNFPSQIDAPTARRLMWREAGKYTPECELIKQMGAGINSMSTAVFCFFYLFYWEKKLDLHHTFINIEAIELTHCIKIKSPHIYKSIKVPVKHIGTSCGSLCQLQKCLKCCKCPHCGTDKWLNYYYLLFKKWPKKSQVNESKRVNIESEDGSRSERIVIQ